MTDPDPSCAVRGDADPAELLDIRRAASRIGCHPETVRRWVWSGRLAARRDGRRLLVARADVDALAAARGRTPDSLAAWSRRAISALQSAGAGGSGASAADLVIGDRAHRSASMPDDAGR